MSGIDRFEMTEEERIEAQKLIPKIDALLNQQKAEAEAVKIALLSDEKFLEDLAKRVATYL